MTNTITDYRGKHQNLSDEIYEIISDDHPSYPKGTKVRLISGVDDSPIPGYHFSSGYKTVFRVDALIAEFCGIRAKRLKRITEQA